MESDKTTLNESAKYSGDPWVPGNQYFVLAEENMDQSWKKLIWPVIKDCNFEIVVDLAAGHGRNSAKLIEYASKLIVMDIQPGNVEVCRKRFEGNLNVTSTICSGYDLSPLPDESVTLVYSFDAMVHFNPDVVQSYLNDTYRTLKPGGRGFFHHSNFTGGKDWKTNPGSRNYMSKAIFADYAKVAGLSLLDQRVIDWGQRPQLDCLTLVEKPPVG